ncbi:MAG: PAS domain-containing protein [Chloroflexi bacterium]|nr:PAS domain-containing protein [Chloroflexota bacterium]MBV9131680.1 PAS domain-containing protein [Chloroflexota bacterium]MBV9896712.1 PAS domain-containing protein [Chloroflexota bacterium]
MQPAILLTPLYVAVAAGCVWLCIRGWRRRVTIPGARWLGLIGLLVALRALCYALDPLSVDDASRLTLDVIAVALLLPLPPLVLLFAAEFTGFLRRLVRSRGSLLRLAAIPAMGLAILLTNGSTGLLWQHVAVAGNNIEHTPGPVYRVISVVEALPYILALLLLTYALVVAPRAFRGQLGWLLVGFSLPGAVEAVLGSGLLPFPTSPSLTSISPAVMPFAFGAVAWTLTRHGRLLDLARIAHGTVVAGMADAVLVVDGLGRIVELNPAAESLLGITAVAAIGQSVQQVAPELASLSAGATDEVQLRDQFLDVQVSDVRGGEGRVIVLRDATRRRLRLLEQQLADMAASRRRVTAAEERLRREIAEMLHSRVQARLLLARLHLDEALMSATDEAIRQSLREVCDDLDRIRETEVREVSHLLHPSIIRMGLVAAVESLADRFERRGLVVRLHASPRLRELDAPPSSALPEELRLTAYRAIEEGLSNVLRHANARSVDITLEIGDAWLSVAVQDDGRGFDPSTLVPSLGLDSVAARVEQIGGEWRLEGAAGSGACLAVRFPLPQAAAAQVQQHGLDARLDRTILPVDAEVAVQPGDRVFDGFGGEHHALGNGHVGQSGREQLE